MTAVVRDVAGMSPVDGLSESLTELARVFAACRHCGAVAQPVGVDCPVDDDGRPVVDRAGNGFGVWFTCPACGRVFDARARLLPTEATALCAWCGTTSPYAVAAVCVACDGCGRRFLPVPIDDLDRGLVAAIVNAAIATDGGGC